ncbi:hypothetical protein Peur_072918 [Populus x canadensis]
MPMMFFYFLKIIFDISTSKRSKKYKPHSILVKKKKFKFAQNTGTYAVIVYLQNAVLQVYSYWFASSISKEQKFKKEEN